MRTKNESELRKSGNSFAQVIRRPRVSTARPPPLHLTTSKVMVIVWRLRGDIIRTVLYIASVPAL